MCGEIRFHFIVCCFIPFAANCFRICLDRESDTGNGVVSGCEAGYEEKTLPIINRAHGVVVSHPLSMREALGSIPSVSIFNVSQGTYCVSQA